MNIQTPASRLTDPNASHDSERHINKSGVRARQQNITSKAVEQYPGLTSLELATKANMCRYMLARRLPELADFSRIIRGQERRCSISKRLAVTWYPKDASVQFDFFAKEKAA